MGSWSLVFDFNSQSAVGMYNFNVKHEYRVHQGIVDKRLETSEIRYSDSTQFSVERISAKCPIHLTFTPELKHFPDILANKQAPKLLDWKFKRNGLKRVFFIHELQV